MLQNRLALSLIYELVWWIFTAVAVFVLILNDLDVIQRYFIHEKILFVVTAITACRYLLFTRQSYLGMSRWARRILIVGIIPFFFVLVTRFGVVVDMFDNMDPLQMTVNSPLPVSVLVEKAMKFKNEYLFFGAAGFVSTALLELRLITFNWWKRR